MIRANDALSFNPKVDAFNYVLPDYTDVDDCHIFRLRRPLPTPPLTQSRPIEARTVLCQVCRNGLEYFAYYVDEARSEQSQKEDHKLPAAVVAHHRDLFGLHKSIASGCHLCTILAWKLDQMYISDDEVEQFLTNTQIELCWRSNSGIFDGQDPQRARINLAVTDSTKERTSRNYHNLLRLQLWPAWKFPHLFAIPTEEQLPSLTTQGGKENDEYESRRIENSTESLPTQELAARWLARCQKNQDGRHSECNQGEIARLPTRLIDVQHALNHSHVRLVSPSQSPDLFEPDRRYITLSHCWGLWGPKEIPVLTTENLEERLERGIGKGMMPSTFQEASEIAGWFQG